MSAEQGPERTSTGVLQETQLQNTLDRKEIRTSFLINDGLPDSESRVEQNHQWQTTNERLGSWIQPGRSRMENTNREVATAQADIAKLIDLIYI